MKRTLAWILSILMVISLLTGCGSNGSETETVEAATKSGSVSDENAEVGADVRVSDVIAEKVVVASYSDLPDMSPWAGEGNGRLDTIIEIYETLFTRLGFGGEFVGVLASGYEEVDEKTFNVTIYDNIYDSNGNPITASDVAFSYNKAIELGNISKIANIDHAEAIDEFTVQLVWKKVPKADDFESMVGKVFVVSEKSYNESPDGMVSTPVGTGPYKVIDYVGGNHVTMEATGNYWQDADKIVAATQLSNVKVIQYDFVTESAQRTIALETGAANLCANISSDDISKFMDGGEYADTYDVALYDNNMCYNLYPNCDASSPLSDINVRLAVFHAIDSAALATSVYGDLAAPLTALANPAYGDYLADWDNNDYFKYDLDLSAQYLKEAGYEPGELTITLLCSSAVYIKRQAELIQAFLDAAGINVEIESLASSMYQNSLKDPTAWDIALAQNASYTYVTTMWLNIFDENNFSWGGTKNFVCDEELQALLTACASREGHTEENIMAFHDYIVENAYIRGNLRLINTVVYDNSLISSVALSQTNDIIPGGCTYVG